MTKVIGAFSVSVVLTLVTAYIFFLPPNLPPAYVYIIVFIVFFGISFMVINAISRRKQRGGGTNASDT